jgi:aminomethyltransferase
MQQRTPLYDCHVAAGARIVDFGGWDMPLHYGSQIDEHHTVRNDAGMFDVSHMTVVDVEGTGAGAYLQRLLANDIGKLNTPGRALYSCMLNDSGGIIDDLIVYSRASERFRVVVNAATRATDLAWMRTRAEGFDVVLAEREDLAMIAVQGPSARKRASQVLPDSAREAALAAKPFHAVEMDDWLVARTGYTGEDGWEITLPGAEAPAVWRRLEAVGVRPCGLGARDTLRLEAGMNLYGTDMDETTTPLESGLGWTVAWEPADREFIGRAALETQREHGVARKFVGLLLEGRGVIRGHQKIVFDDGVGEVTSGTFSPTIGRAIGMGRVPASAGGDCRIEIRGKELPARIVKPPFVRNGKICIDV